MKRNNIFLRKPLEDMDFQALFKFIWAQGIGNNFDCHGDPQPWTDHSLETRFYEFNYQIDKRTIQNWLSGANEPSSKNLNRLARVISNNDKHFLPFWRDALTLAKLKSGALVKPISVDIEKADLTEPLDTMINSSQNRTPLFWSFIASLVVTICIVSIAYVFRQQSDGIAVTNLKFCDKARFSKSEKLCKTNVTHFPAGTHLVYVSFNLPNAPEGGFFERKWYRNGVLFLEKEGYVDSAWEDYTWLMNPDGHDNGKFDLRIIINKHVSTGTFYIGEVDTSHQEP